MTVECKEMVLLDKAEQAIIQAKSIDEIKDIIDKAEVIRQYAKKAQKGLIIQNRAAEIKLLAERQAGAWLKRSDLKAGRPKENGNKQLPLKDLGVSKMQSSRYQAVASLPEKDFKKHVAAVKDSNKELTTVGVIKLARELNQNVKNENFKPKEIPKGTFDVIYADPPWKYDFSPTAARAIEKQYPTMELEDICDLKVPAAKDCILFLWATNPKLEEAFKVLSSWDFEYRTNMVWVKDKIGMGHYARSRHELLLIAKRGNIEAPMEKNRPDSVIMAERNRHSEKPKIVYDLIERMFPGRTYVELFARNERKGWQSWINQS